GSGAPTRTTSCPNAAGLETSAAPSESAGRRAKALNSCRIMRSPYCCTVVSVPKAAAPNQGFRCKQGIQSASKFDPIGMRSWRGGTHHPQHLFAELRTTIEADSAIHDETALISAMAKSSIPRSSELEVLLEPRRGELVRTFVREASLAEDAPVSVASLVAGAAVDVWQALCTPGSGRERVRIVTLAVRREIKVRILLPGYSRFSNIAASLGGLARRDGGISWRERGIDGWEVSIHRSLSANAEPPVPAVEKPGPQPVPASATAHDYVIDLPQQKDAAAIARCFLEVYGHHYVHSEVFSTRRYWEKVESSELIPVVARDSEGE